MLHDAATRRPPKYDRVLARSKTLKFSMNSDALTGALLRTLARTKPGGSFLELGTGCGLGTCWLLDGMSSGSRLISVDIDPRAQAIAREELEPDDRLTFVLGDGGTFLEKSETRFDLIYADAWPGKYTHLEHALDLLNQGGMYVIDDMLPQSNWPADHAPKVDALLAALDATAGIDTVRLSWSTGVVIAVKC
jgi:predicted O-methyltransferase YrrM